MGTFGKSWEILRKFEKIWESDFTARRTFAAQIKNQPLNSNKMNKVSTTVVIGIVCVAMLGVVIFLQRDKFHTSKKEVEAAEE